MLLERPRDSFSTTQHKAIDKLEEAEHESSELKEAFAQMSHETCFF